MRGCVCETKMPHFRNTPTVKTSLTLLENGNGKEEGKRPTPQVFIHQDFYRQNGALLRVLQGRNQTKELLLVRVNGCVCSHRVE